MASQLACSCLTMHPVTKSELTMWCLPGRCLNNQTKAGLTIKMAHRCRTAHMQGPRRTFTFPSPTRQPQAGSKAWRSSVESGACGCCEYTDIFPFSPLLFIVLITFLISFRSYYLNHAIQKLRIYSYVFPIKNAFYLTIGTLGTCSEPTEPCSDILGNFLLKQVTSKALCSAQISACHLNHYLT